MKEKAKVSSGNIEIRTRLFHFELWSDDVNYFIKVFTADGKEIEFARNKNNSLKTDIEAVLVTHGVISE